ncbi:sodium:calcium antiporter [Balneolaceae bacterium YR4-1]|uniref:Sodium:calcium antiporter n=1 Tax=Halalkalibaculum roseum TaxID=2709311 RepID=A0A6M1SMA0_9BACT|nr:sodium:calcium antiporter [Halalkalibaculum roseum]NGP76139.1 sodium:calcium antiporter [Halalkalibaculum roseum]
MITAVSLFIIGLVLVVYFSEKLVEGVVGTSLSFGISAFLISVIFIGFDPENLVLGGVASYEAASGIALGTIIGSAMVAIALAFGITAIIAPMKFKSAPAGIVIVPVASVALLVLLSLDGMLTRLDGIYLLGGFFLALWYLVRLSSKGLDIEATGEVAETIEKETVPAAWKSVGMLIISLIAIIVGSELLIRGSETIIDGIGLTETVFGMTLLALLVSFEELARELPAALKGRPDISYGNVSGSVLAFFLFNAGIIALINPVPIPTEVLYFHLPVSVLTIVFISMCMLAKRVTRWSGLILVLLYTVFFVGSFFR